MSQRYTPNEIESILDRIRQSLTTKHHKSKLSYLELEEREEAIILKITSTKTIEEKKAILAELAGSGLKYGSSFIEDAIALAEREEEEDREDLDIG